MSMISFRQSGDFSKTFKFLEKAKHMFELSVFDKYGRAGVEALRAATPVDTGITANSWYYEIEKNNDSLSIVWKNRNVNQNVLIAAIIQYGHGTGTGGYVKGVDYINPAMRPVFQKIADDMWKEVVKS